MYMYTQAIPRRQHRYLSSEERSAPDSYESIIQRIDLTFPTTGLTARWESMKDGWRQRI